MNKLILTFAIVLYSIMSIGQGKVEQIRPPVNPVTNTILCENSYMFYSGNSLTTVPRWVYEECDAEGNVTIKDCKTDATLAIIPFCGPAETVTTLVDNGDGSFTYTNEGVVEVTYTSPISEFTDNGDGTYTHTSGDGTVTTTSTDGNLIQYISQDTIWISHTASDGSIQMTYTYYDFDTTVVAGIQTVSTYEVDENGNQTFVHESKCDLCLLALTGQLDPCDPRISTRDCDGGGFSNGLECQFGTGDPNDGADDDCTGFAINNVDICDYLAGNPDDAAAVGSLDCDMSGLTNAIECANGGNPLDGADDCTIIDNLNIDVCANLLTYGDTDCDGGGVPAQYDCPSTGGDPDDPTDDCEQAIVNNLSICQLIAGDTNHPLADLDCDNAGYPNLIECLNGLNPNDDGDDTTAVTHLLDLSLDGDYEIGETYTATGTICNDGPFDQTTYVVTDLCNPNSPTTINATVAPGACMTYNYTGTISNPDSTLCTSSVVATDIYGVTATDISDNGTTGDSTAADGDEMGDDDASVIIAPCMPLVAYTSQVSGNSTAALYTIGGPFMNGYQNDWDTNSLQVDYWGITESYADSDNETFVSDVHTLNWNYDPCIEATQPTFYQVAFSGVRINGLIAKDTIWVRKNAAANCANGQNGSKFELVFRLRNANQNASHFTFDLVDCEATCVNVQMRMTAFNEISAFFGATTNAYFTVNGGPQIAMPLDNSIYEYDECLEPGLYNFRGVIETATGYRSSQEWQILVQ